MRRLTAILRRAAGLKATPRRYPQRARRGALIGFEPLEQRQLLTAQPLSLVETDPRGWLILDAKTTQAIRSSGATSYSASLQAGQHISLALTSPQASTSLVLSDPSGAVASQANAAAGLVANISSFVVPTSGTWIVSVGTPSGIAGSYTLETAVNAIVEGSDSTASGPRDITGSYMVLPNGIGRYAAVGTSNPIGGSEIDSYQVSLAGQAGKAINIQLTGHNGADFSGQKLELIGPGGNVVATAAPSSASGNTPSLVISSYPVPVNGVYTLRLTSSVAGDYGLVLSTGQASGVSTAVAGSGAPNSTAVLNWLVSGGWTTQTSVSSLVATLSFNDVFTSMTTDELLNQLIDYGLTGAYQDIGSLKAAIAARSIDLTSLRPDGVLTALGNASGGTMLFSGTIPLSAPQAKLLLQTDFSANAVQFLNVFTPSEIVGLFDNSIPAATGVVDQLWALSTKTVTGGSNIATTYPLWITNPAAYTGLPTPQAALAATSAMPAGQRAIFLLNYAEVAGFGGGVDPGSGYVDPYTASGSLNDYYLLWDTQWQQIVANRMTTFFTQYKQLGGQLDTLFTDIEDSSWSYYAMQTLDHRVNTSVAPTRTVWQALLADPRWPALQQQLIAAGIPAADLTLNNIGTWDLHSDDAARWDAVMEQRLNAALNTAIYQPLKALFPNVRVSNYGSSYSTDTIPAGRYELFGQSYYTAGGVVGTAQSQSLYGDATYVSTPSGVSQPSIPFAAAIAQISFSQNRLGTGQLTTNGVATVTFFSPIAGLKAGQQITVENRGSVFVDPQYTGNFTILWVSADGTQIKYWMPLTSVSSAPAAVNLTARQSAYTSGYVDFWQPYQTLVSEVKFLRTQAAASTAPILPWISDPDYIATQTGYSWTYYTEMLFHAALSGATDFLWWKASWDPSASNTAIVSAALNELNPLIGYADRTTLTLTNTDWSDGYVLTGMQANGKDIYRLTPDPTLPVTILSSSGTVRIQIGSQVVSIPNSYIYTPSHSASTLGYWIIQTQGTTNLTASRGTVIAALQSTMTPTVSGPVTGLTGAAQHFTLSVNAPSLPGSSLYSFNIDWNGDGHYDQTVVGPSGTQITAVYNGTGTYNVQISASLLGSGQAMPVGSTTISIISPVFALVPDSVNPSLTDLYFVANSGPETATFSTPAANTVQVVISFNGEMMTQTFTGVTGRVIAYQLSPTNVIAALRSMIAMTIYGSDMTAYSVGGLAENDVLITLNGHPTFIRTPVTG